MDFSVDNVREAVNVLLHNPDPNAKQQASQWLEELQKSVRVHNLLLLTSRRGSYVACTRKKYALRKTYVRTMPLFTFLIAWIITGLPSRILVKLRNAPHGIKPIKGNR